MTKLRWVDLRKEWKVDIGLTAGDGGKVNIEFICNGLVGRVKCVPLM